MPDLPEITSYAIEQPLQTGNTLRCFLSGQRLRVVRILSEEGQLVGYGEAPTLDVALMDAAENYHTGEGYERQYLGDDARYPHRTDGSNEAVSDVDRHLLRGGKILARWTGSQVLAELHALKEVPDIATMDEAIIANGLPTMVTQLGRSFLLDGMPGWYNIVSLNADDVYVAVARSGEGATLRKAIGAALTAEEIELPKA